MSLATAAPAQGSTTIPTLAEPSTTQQDEIRAKVQREIDEKRRELQTRESELLARRQALNTTEGEDKKKKKRSLFGFGKKKTEPAQPASTSKPATTRTTAASPIQTDRARFSPSSPGRAGFASSPRLASPAGSQIFERNVQESSVSLMPSSPAIPSHIQTENYIPPVLDASSEAITDDHLNPDTVEIITHTSHQPASVTVTGLNPYGDASWADELAAFSSGTTTTAADTASNYGSFDTTDVRRLSFISFADVVQAEHGGFSPGSPPRDSMHLAGLTSFTSNNNTNTHNRSPSPIRSPVSSAGGGVGPGGASPPLSQSGSVRGGLEAAARARASSPSGKSLGSPTSMMSMSLSPVASSTTGNNGGEIAIETMSQALRRTGSGDLSVGNGVRSFPTSPI
ncbi:uncharacterized protein B0H64DRAFT_111599 [Chaetomium fimeti]|uniref:Uncharacterized protein n=1 Tax=Chaetomium fimeti TaxID=1854472 RepID=A0AAE0LT67_9PEZI|nr:hypothetical protein B0H64DRAFT_111599 [Chaetomium fimeti]